MLTDFARQQRLDVYDTYIDDGWSGTNFDRPAFQRLIADIEAKKVNMVITKDLSRLGRDYIMTGHYMERYFPEHRVRYHLPAGRRRYGRGFHRERYHPFPCHYERHVRQGYLQEDFQRQARQAAQGISSSAAKPVYGYKLHPTEKNKIVIDEEAAPIVRRIFSMALEGMSLPSNRGEAQ